MVRKSTLLERTRTNQQNVRFSDLVALAQVMGFVPSKQRGTSHRRFVQPSVGIYLNLSQRRMATPSQTRCVSF